MRRLVIPCKAITTAVKIISSTKCTIINHAKCCSTISDFWKAWHTFGMFCFCQQRTLSNTAKWLSWLNLEGWMKYLWVMSHPLKLPIIKNFTMSFLKIIQGSKLSYKYNYSVMRLLKDVCHISQKEQDCNY